MIDARAEAESLHALGWTSAGVRNYHRAMCMSQGWTDDECEAVAVELEGLVG